MPDHVPASEFVKAVRWLFPPSEEEKQLFEDVLPEEPPSREALKEVLKISQFTTRKDWKDTPK